MVSALHGYCVTPDTLGAVNTLYTVFGALMMNAL